MKQKEETQVLDQVVNIDSEIYELSKKMDTFHIIEMILKFSNDQTLGNEIRKYYLSLKND
jgi:hypothetical protein